MRKEEICTEEFMKKVVDTVNAGAYALLKREGKVHEVGSEALANLIGWLHKLLPEATIMNEELWLRGLGEGEEYAWAITPMDSIVNYSHRLPGYMICVCLMLRREPILSVVYDVYNDTMYAAVDGIGAFADGEKLTVSDNDTWHSVVSIGSGLPKLNERTDILDTDRRLFIKYEAVRMYGSIGMSLCLLAEGCVDAVHYVDIAGCEFLAGVLIAAAAGASVEYKVNAGRSEVWAATGANALNTLKDTIISKSLV